MDTRTLSFRKKVVAVVASVLLAFLGFPVIATGQASAQEGATATEQTAPSAEQSATNSQTTSDSQQASAQEAAPASGQDANQVAGEAAGKAANQAADKAADQAASQTASQPAGKTDDKAAGDAANTTNAVAQVTIPSGTVSYESLPQALEQAPEGATVAVLKDVDLPAQFMDGNNLSLSLKKGVTIDGNGHTITVHARGIYMTGGDDAQHSAAYVFRNVTITNPDDFGRSVSARNGFKTLRFEATTIETTGNGNTQVFTLGGNTPEPTSVAFDGCTLKASPAGYGIITFNPIDLTLADTDVSGYAALYLKGPESSAGSSGSKITVTDGSVLSSQGIPGDTNRFGTIVLQNVDHVAVNVTNATVEAQANNADDPDATTQAAVFYSGIPDGNGVAAHDNTVVFGQGAKVKTEGTASQLATTNGQKNAVQVTGGEYALAGPVVLGGATADDPNETSVTVTGGKWNKDVSDFVPDGYASTRKGGGERPYVVGEKAIEPSTPDQPGTNPGGTDKPATPDQPGGTDQTPSTHEGDGDNQGSDQGSQQSGQQSGDKTGTTGADDKADATAGANGNQASGSDSKQDAADNADKANNADNANKADSTDNADKATDSATKSTHEGGTNEAKQKGEEVPKTGDQAPALAFSLAMAVLAISSGAFLVLRNRNEALKSA